MGTNFYARRLPTEEERILIQERLSKYLTGESNDSDIWQDCDNLNSIHLGKRSSGWQFHWQTSNFYEQNLESIKAFLSRTDVVIYDEYEQIFTVDEFFNEEIGDILYNDPVRAINGEQYNKMHPSQYNDPSFEWTSEDGLRFSERDFS